MAALMNSEPSLQVFKNHRFSCSNQIEVKQQNEMILLNNNL